MRAPPSSRAPATSRQGKAKAVKKQSLAAISGREGVEPNSAEAEIERLRAELAARDEQSQTEAKRARAEIEKARAEEVERAQAEIEKARAEAAEIISQLKLTYTAAAPPASCR